MAVSRSAGRILERDKGGWVASPVGSPADLAAGDILLAGVPASPWRPIKSFRALMASLIQLNMSLIVSWMEPEILSTTLARLPHRFSQVDWMASNPFPQVLVMELTRLLMALVMALRADSATERMAFQVASQ